MRIQNGTEKRKFGKMRIIWPLIQPLAVLLDLTDWLMRRGGTAIAGWHAGFFWGFALYFGAMGIVAEPFPNLAFVITVVVIALMLWVVGMVVNWLGETDDKFHPLDKFVLSFLFGPFWLMVWHVLLFINSGGL